MNFHSILSSHHYIPLPVTDRNVYLPVQLFIYPSTLQAVLGQECLAVFSAIITTVTNTKPRMGLGDGQINTASASASIFSSEHTSTHITH